MKRIFVVFASVAVMVATAAVPAMAQNADKAARLAEKQAQRAAKAEGASSNAAPATGGAQKALPSSGGMPAGNIALLDASALPAGGGILLYKKSTVS